eukprot:9590-Heterococcus_DN1.PRE.3
MQLCGHSLCQQHRVQWKNKPGNKGCPLCGEAKIISSVCKGFPCASTSGNDGTSAMEHLRQGPEQQHHNLIDNGVKAAVISEDIKYGLTLGGVEILKTGLHDKIVVFSQYQRQLNVLAEDLRNNGVVFEKPTGKGDKTWSNPIDRFNTNEDCRALLLPIRACGRGLNLTQAAAVIFMEPVTDSLLYAQAIRRINRMGQKHYATNVVTYIKQESIEERLYARQSAAAQTVSDDSDNSDGNDDDGNDDDDDDDDDDDKLYDKEDESSRKRKRSDAATATAIETAAPAAPEVPPPANGRVVIDISSDSENETNAGYEDDFEISDDDDIELLDDAVGEQNVIVLSDSDDDNGVEESKRNSV